VGRPILAAAGIQPALVTCAPVGFRRQDAPARDRRRPVRTGSPRRAHSIKTVRPWPPPQPQTWFNCSWTARTAYVLRISRLFG
jgi:hypothetical protein